MKRILMTAFVSLVATGAAAQFPRLPKLPKQLPEKIPGVGFSPGPWTLSQSPRVAVPGRL